MIGFENKPKGKNPFESRDRRQQSLTKEKVLSKTMADLKPEGKKLTIKKRVQAKIAVNENLTSSASNLKKLVPNTTKHISDFAPKEQTLSLKEIFKKNQLTKLNNWAQNNTIDITDGLEGAQQPKLALLIADDMPNL